MACDVSAPGEAQAFVSYAVSKLGLIDRWINNPRRRGSPQTPALGTGADDIDEMCRTNLCGAIMLCAEIVRVMLRQPFEGTEPSFDIFNMGFSAAGVRSSPTAVSHRASKRAVALATGFLDAELKKAGVAPSECMN
jgi:chlorophyll(ide) b reductase